MELKNKIPAPVGDVQRVARALLSWLNGFPDKPVKRLRLNIWKVKISV